MSLDVSPGKHENNGEALQGSLGQARQTGEPLARVLADAHMEVLPPNGASSGPERYGVAQVPRKRIRPMMRIAIGGGLGGGPEGRAGREDRFMPPESAGLRRADCPAVLPREPAWTR